MKKLPLLFAASLLLVSLCFTGCLTSMSSNGSGNVTVSNPTVTVNLYDNCPTEDLYAAAAQLTLKATNSNYNGVTSFSYQGTPTISAVGPVLGYYASCETIRLAIEKGHGTKCKLTFNTQADGKGVALDFSNSSAAVTSLLYMAVYNYTNVFAIYTF
ncbi:MAG TPA: hypothetical protein DEO40_05175 [Treponema sp.]|nr:hypothetical protein [Treponema sp.]HBB41975.1 hypothetical protein [Treponema sp.]HCA20048.1 hypothetical protein [Treponema sp.]